MSDSTVRQLSLAPLGAGDLIDRAVRLYRRHLFILIRTAAPPVIVAALGGILVSIGFRQVVSVSETSEVLYTRAPSRSKILNVKRCAEPTP